MKTATSNNSIIACVPASSREHNRRNYSATLSRNRNLQTRTCHLWHLISARSNQILVNFTIAAASPRWHLTRAHYFDARQSIVARQLDKSGDKLCGLQGADRHYR